MRKMRSWTVACAFFLLACAGEDPSKVETTRSTNTTSTSTQPATADTAEFADYRDTTNVVTNAAVKKPSGFYQFYLPQGGEYVIHTIAFYPGTFRLEEEYSGRQDSVVVTVGTWSPSQGSIWLYKDQIVRGRYSWKGDTLQYFSPRLKKLFSMTELTPAGSNAVWQTKKKEGSVFYSVGTEPFWSVEIDKKNFITVSMPDFTTPLKVKFKDRVKTKDSTVYSAPADSLRLVVYPNFCNDGMSDFIYTSKVRFTYNGRRFEGCGVAF